jgi:hypothetical protein
MSLKIKVINRKTGKELEMEQSEAQKLKKLVKFQAQEPIKVPKEYTKRARKVLLKNISDKTEEE